jgi:16S rRNA processing protein RimM
MVADQATGQSAEEGLVLVGEITAPHGVRGQVKMQPLMEKPESLAALPAVRLRFADGREEKRRITAAQKHQKQVLLRVAGVPDRDAAETLRGAQVLIRRDQLPVLEPDAYYESDLIGLDVVTEGGQDLGRIEKIHYNPAANDVYETPLALIPAVDAVVASVDLSARRVRVRDIPGLRKDA